MAEVRRHVRPPSTTARAVNSSSRDSPLKKTKFTKDRLNDLARDPQRMTSFARLKVRSKSAKCFEEESLDIKKESKKQAWAPKSKQNLSSSSSKFQRYGRVETVADFKFHSGGTEMPQSKPHPAKEFGRVATLAIAIQPASRPILL